MKLSLFMCMLAACLGSPPQCSTFSSIIMCMTGDVMFSHVRLLSAMIVTGVGSGKTGNEMEMLATCSMCHSTVH